MCLEYVKDKRIIALWFSGFFGAAAVKSFILFVLGLKRIIPIVELTIEPIWNLPIFLVSASISVLLVIWASKQLKRK